MMTDIYICLYLHISNPERNRKQRYAKKVQHIFLSPTQKQLFVCSCYTNTIWWCTTSMVEKEETNGSAVVVVEVPVVLHVLEFAFLSLLGCKVLRDTSL